MADCSNSAELVFHGAPLWPAGHLPHEGGDRLSPAPSPVVGGAGRALSAKLLISPLVGEMAGRPEGGVKEHGGAGTSLSVQDRTP